MSRCKELLERFSKLDEGEIKDNTLLKEGDRFQGKVDGELFKLRVLRSIGKYCQIVNMAKEGTSVGMLPKDSMRFGDIEWTKKGFEKIKDVMFN